MKKIDNIFEDTGLTSNMEDYMEAISFLSDKNRIVRVKDIANFLKIKMPSVSAALNKLRDMGLIDYEKYGFIELTEKGRSIAQRVCRRHSCLSEFFERILFMDQKEADTEACKVEHALGPHTCSQINAFLDFFKAEEKQNSKWIARLKRTLKK